MSDKDKQKLFTSIYQVLHAQGVALDLKQMEKVRNAVNNLTVLIQDMSKKEAVELIRELQEELDKAFKRAYKHVDTINSKVRALEKKLNEDSHSGTDQRKD